MSLPLRLLCAFFFLFFAFTTAVASAQQEPVPNLQGEVLERGTREPLVGVTVVIFTGPEENPVAYESITDDAGRFVFFDLKPGLWSVAMEEVNYLLYQTSEDIEPNQLTEVVYYLEPTSTESYDVLIQGQQERKEVTTHRIKVKAAAKQPGSLGDPLRSVTNLPGLARVDFTSSDLYARGSGAENTRTLVEGFDVPTLFHFGGLRSTIAAPMLDTLNFSPGNYSAVYGRATGGILEVKLAELKPEAMHGYADINVFDTGVYLETPITDTLSVAVAGRRSYIDTIFDVLLGDEENVNFASPPRYYDGQLLLSWHPNRNHSVRLFAVVADDIVDFTQNNIQEADVRATSGKITNHLQTQYAAILYKTFINETMHNQMNVGVSNYTQSQDIIGLNLDVTLFEPFVVNTFTWQPDDAFSLSVGGDARASIGSVEGRLGDVLNTEGDPAGDDPLGNIRRVDVDKTFVSGGFFAEATLKPTEKLQITPGLRADIQQWSGTLTGDARLSTHYQLLDMLAVKAGWGLFHQGPQVLEVLEGRGNPDIDAEEAVHYSAGLEVRPWETGLIDVTGFYKTLDNQIVNSDLTTVKDGDVVPLYYDNSGRGRAYGLELQVRQNLTHGFSGWIAYTLSRSERWDPAQNNYRLFDQDQTHVLTAVASYKLPWNMDLGLRWRLASSNPETGITGSIYEADQDSWDPIFGKTNGERQQAFHQLDVRLDKTWIFDTWRLNTYLDVQNAYNQANPEGSVWNEDYSEKQTLQGLPIIPSLGLRGEF